MASTPVLPSRSHTRESQWWVRPAIQYVEPGQSENAGSCTERRKKVRLKVLKCKAFSFLLQSFSRLAAFFNLLLNIFLRKAQLKT